MSTNEPIYGKCKENSGKTIMARIVGHPNSPITQATLSNLFYMVRQYTSKSDAVNDENGTVVTAETALTIASTIYDTLQTGSGWDTDDATHLGPDGQYGFNFRYDLPATSFPDGNKWYRVEIWCDPASGADFLGALFFLDCMATTR